MGLKTSGNRPPAVTPRKRVRASSKCKNFRDEIVASILDRGRTQLNRIYLCDVPSFNTDGLSCTDLWNRTKEWMEGPEVRRALQRRGRVEREGGRFAFKLLKKLMPEPCKCVARSNERAWVERQTREADLATPDEFFSYVRLEVGNMFPQGWDRSYIDAIAKYAPNTSACVERSCKKGGSRAEVDLDDYLAKVIGEREVEAKPLKYSEVLTSGKLRSLTIAPADYNVLRPLHKIIFDRVKKQRWSLIGPPSAEKFEKAGFKFDGTPLLSGDYKAATDNLDLRVSSTILSAILERADIVPESVKAFALASLYPQVTVGGRVVDVKRGQMMGSLLSFPLLCIYNRVASVLALGKVPMLINGDDIVAETRRPERWLGYLPILGLEPERSKTGISKTRLEVNSTPFVVRGGRAIICPVARLRVLAPRSQTGVVGGELAPFTDGMAGSVKRRAEDEFVRAKRGLIRASLHKGLTLPLLGFRGPSVLTMLTRTGLLSEARSISASLPGTALPPRPPSGHTLTTTPIYGSSIESKTVLAMTRTHVTASLFGRKMEYEGSTAYVRRWWEELNEAGIRTLPRVPVRRINAAWANLKPVPRYHGDLISRAIWYRRLSSQLEMQTPVRQRVLDTLLRRIPCQVRWGIL